MKYEKKMLGRRVKSTLVAHTFLSVCCACLCVFTSALAQPFSTDTLAEVRCTNVVVMPPLSLEFDIVLSNRSREGAPSHASWERWANGTFMLNIQNLRPTNNRLNEIRCDLDSTSLPIIPRPENAVRTGYEVKIFLPAVPSPMLNQASEQRVALAFIGADSTIDCSLVQLGTARLLGRFRVEFADTIQEPERIGLAWATPLEKFQANAFKVAQKIAFQGIQLQANDNAEMFTTFSMDAPVVEFPPELTTSSFTAEYAGDKRVKLTWNTLLERVGRRTNAGFVLLRKTVQEQDTTRFDTVAHFRTAPALRLRGNTRGSVYEYQDSVRFRGDILLYRLVAVDATPRRPSTLPRSPMFQATITRDTASVRIPNAVFKQTSTQPNPFATQCRITYTLEDRARISAIVYDATGRMVTRLADNIEQSRGAYSLTLDGTRFPEQLASQGALLLVLTALPTDDAAVEKSEAVLKLQFIR
jgi:hypothetical protein